MQIVSSRIYRFLGALALLPTLAGCDVTSVRVGQPGQLAVVVNSVDNSLTLVSADSAGSDARLVGLGSVAASPVSAAARHELVVVPLGIYPFAAVVSARLGTLVGTLPLPANSGATGVAFLNDSIALVGNPNRNSVSPLNLARASVGAEIPVGVFPQALVAGNDRVYVLNGNLVNFAVAGPGSVSVVNQAGQVTATIPLSGLNPSAGVVRNGKLYVVNAGTFGGNNGTLSVVDLATAREEHLATGFGEFPGALDVGPDGNVYVAVYGVGILVWNPGTHSFVRGPGNPLVPGGVLPVSGVGFDSHGRMHTVNPGDCSGAGRTLRTSGSSVDRTVNTGICPFSITFADLGPTLPD
jgi:hypothetical protein